MEPRKIVQIKVDLKGRTLQRYEEIKEFYGVEFHSEVLRIMINNEYRKILPELEKLQLKKEPKPSHDPAPDPTEQESPR